MNLFIRFISRLIIGAIMGYIIGVGQQNGYYNAKFSILMCLSISLILIVTMDLDKKD